MSELAKLVDRIIGGRTTKAIGARSLTKQTAAWLVAVVSLYDARTHGQLRIYAAHWPAFFGDSVDAVDAAALARFMAARLGKVIRKTVTKELWALRAFLTWSFEVARTITAIPTFPKIPRRALGVRSGRQRVTIVELSREDVDRLLAAIDDVTAPLPAGVAPPPGRPRTPGRRGALGRYTLMAETGLRPETIDLLSVPEHFTPDATTLNITADIDKNRWARVLPLTPRARAVLVAAAPKSGPIFGRQRWVDVFKEAAAKAGLPKETSPYDLRHAFGTHGVEASGGNLTGVAYLLGHTQVTTTNRYVHSNAKAADAVLASLAVEPTRSPPAAKVPLKNDAAAAAATVGKRPNASRQRRESTRPSSQKSGSGSGGVTPVRVQVPSFALNISERIPAVARMGRHVGTSGDGTHNGSSRATLRGMRGTRPPEQGCFRRLPD